MINNLSDTDLFRGLREEEILKILKQFAVEKKFVKGEYIFSKGEKPKYMFILIEGSLTVFSDDAMGKRELLSSFKTPGVLFGEVYLYLSKSSYDFYAISDTDVKLIAISRDFFNNLYDFENDLGRIVTENYLRILSDKLYYFNQKIRMMSGFTLRQKLARYILENSNGSLEFKMNYNREELADYLGTTRPSVSRELNNMQNDNLISIDRSKIKILDLEGLKNYS